MRQSTALVISSAEAEAEWSAIGGLPYLSLSQASIVARVFVPGVFVACNERLSREHTLFVKGYYPQAPLKSVPCHDRK